MAGPAAEGACSLTPAPTLAGSRRLQGTEGGVSAVCPVQTACGSATWETDTPALRLNDPGSLGPAPPHAGQRGCECGDTGRPDGRMDGWKLGLGAAPAAPRSELQAGDGGKCSQPLVPHFPPLPPTSPRGHRDSDILPARTLSWVPPRRAGCGQLLCGVPRERSQLPAFSGAELVPGRGCRWQPVRAGGR